MTESEITLEIFILSQSRETKIRWMKSILDEGNFSAWFHLTKILLEHPINKGGIETKVIEKIYKEWKK